MLIRLVAVVEMRSLRLLGTACWIWLEIESTALRTLPTASLTRSVTVLEVTEVARDKNEDKPPASRRLDLGGDALLMESSTLRDDGAKVTLFDLLELMLVVDDIVPWRTFALVLDTSAGSVSPNGSGNAVEYLEPPVELGGAAKREPANESVLVLDWYLMGLWLSVGESTALVNESVSSVRLAFEKGL